MNIMNNNNINDRETKLSLIMPFFPRHLIITINDGKVVISLDALPPRCFHEVNKCVQEFISNRKRKNKNNSSAGNEKKGKNNSKGTIDTKENEEEAEIAVGDEV